jgi:hypothetical protein
VGRWFLIDAMGAALVALGWYFAFTRYNYRRGIQALRWVSTACADEGSIVQARWLGASRLQANLRLATHWFERVRVTVRLFPRPLPFHWLLCIFRKQKETLTFEADLDCAPGFALEVFRQRWFNRGEVALAADSQNWLIARPGPVVFSTRPQWTNELPPVVHTFMTSRGHNLISVRFRPESPHLVATIALEAVSDQEAAKGFLTVLHDLATGASASRQ